MNAVGRRQGHLQRLIYAGKVRFVRVGVLSAQPPSGLRRLSLVIGASEHVKTAQHLQADRPVRRGSLGVFLQGLKHRGLALFQHLQGLGIRRSKRLLGNRPGAGLLNQHRHRGQLAAGAAIERVAQQRRGLVPRQAGLIDALENLPTAMAGSAGRQQDQAHHDNKHHSYAQNDRKYILGLHHGSPKKSRASGGLGVRFRPA